MLRIIINQNSGSLSFGEVGKVAHKKIFEGVFSTTMPSILSIPCRNKLAQCDRSKQSGLDLD